MKKYAILLLSLFVLTTCESDDPIQYKLSTQVNPPEGGTISPSSGTFDEGEEITFTAKPSDEYVFKNWSDDASGNENPMTVVMTDDMFVTANFEKKTYSLTIEIEGQGTVNEQIIQAKSSKDYPLGTTIQLSATPADGWEFVRWLGDIESTENPITLTITGPMTIKCVFDFLNKEQVFVPDDNFEQALIDMGYDNKIDDHVYSQLVKEVTELRLENKGIEDLTGIEGFENLEILNVSNNLLKKIDITKNSLLSQLYCQSNQLTSLDISHNKNLVVLISIDNQLTCIQINSYQLFWMDFVGGPAAPWWATDEGVEYSTGCSVSDDQRTYVPDDALEQTLIDEGVDDVLDDYVKTIEIINRPFLDISGRGISDLTGLEDFTGLAFLDASDNNLATADISEWGLLHNVNFKSNPLSCVQISEEQQMVLGREMSIETDDEVLISLDCGN